MDACMHAFLHACARACMQKSSMRVGQNAAVTRQLGHEEVDAASK